MKNKVTIKKIAVTAAVLLAVIAAVSIWLHYENTASVVTEYTVSDSDIPAAFDGFKIAQVSDFHNTTDKGLTQSLVTEIRRQQPDLIVLTGDLIDANRTDIDVAVHFVAQIADAAPVYYVSGNHESSVSQYGELKERMNALGVVILENQSVALETGGAALTLMGIDDPTMAHERSVPEAEIVRTELNWVDSDNECYTILLSHRPELIDVYAERGIDLVFTGHAHGGQIRIPYVGGLVAPSQGFFPTYTEGVFVQGDTSMIVSRGIGNSILPFRINNRPELVVAVLRAKQ